MKKIGITLGDPKGIGPEIVFKALELIPFDLRSSIKVYREMGSDELSDLEAANFAKLSLDMAIADIKNGLISVLVTAPVNKKRMQLVDPNFSGHTEYLAGAFNVKDVVMMFVSTLEGRPLRVSLVTTHLPLKEISSSITTERLLSVVRLTNGGLKLHFGIKNPRIAILGLNPHQGEKGLLGREEGDVIIPAINSLKKEGIDCFGPASMENLLCRTPSDFDVIVAMYHDQGITPLKILCGERLVNMTLGLPFVRTSPAHGTAEDIAGKGRASAVSMVDAIKVAIQTV